MDKGERAMMSREKIERNEEGRKERRGNLMKTKYQRIN